MAQPPTLGTYATTSVVAGKNTIVTPSAAPINATRIVVRSTAQFRGLLNVNPVTGAVTVTDALHAGSYPIAIVAFNGSFPVPAFATFTLTVTSPACSQASFVASPTVPMGNYPNAIAIGDFNRDGIQDFVATNYNQNAVAIKLGNGTGGFVGATTVPVGLEPTAIAVGEFNGDGIQDFVTVNIADNTLSVRMGDGLGGFTGGTNIALGGVMEPLGVTIGDFNEDGFDDIAGADGLNNQVFIRLGNGLGGFTVAPNVSVDFTPSGVTIADFNGDGHQDLATPSFGSTTVSIRLGNGVGQFTGTLNAPAGTQGPQAVAIGDFNEDGKQDFVVTNDNANQATVRLGDGVGGFGATITVNTGATPYGLAVGDFNGDGHQDFITANISSSNASLFLGNGTGNFTSGGSLSTGGQPFSVVVGEFNGDNLQDVAITSTAAQNVSIYLGVVNEIDVLGNAVSITDGDATPALSDFTDFGSIAVGSPVAHTYTISNLGAGPLHLASGAITLTGTDAAMFVVSGISLPTTLAAGASTTFMVTFTPTSAGLKSATLNIANDDCNEGTYDFAFQGNGTSSCIGAAFSACPSAMTATVAPGTCAATVNYTATESGTPVVTLTYAITGATTGSGSGTGSGSSFNAGLSTVTITATNACGIATCVFDVTVTDNIAPVAICHNATVVLDGTGNGTLSAAAVDNGSTDNCGIASLAVTPNTFNCTNVGSPMPPSIWINEIHYDNTGTDVGEFVELAGTAGINLANYAIVRYNGSVPGAAVIYTTPAQTTVLTGTIPNQSNGYGTFAVTYAQDGLQNGNNDGFALVNTLTSTVVQLLSYEGTLTVASGQGLASGMVSTNLPVSELGTITGGSIRLSGTGNAYGSFTWQAQAAPASPNAINAGQVFTPAGGSTVTLTVTDVHANTSTCTADITIQDNEVPVITCPANISVSAVTGTCDATVTYTAPVGTDNCTPTTTQTAGLASGVAFPVGVTTNTFSVTDGHSNTATCSFTVTVMDTELPVLACLASIGVSNDPGSCGAVVTFSAPIGTDNCPGVTTTQTVGLASGATFPNGITSMVFTTTDASGNTTDCMFTVEVMDTEAPTWSACPSNITLASPSSSCDAVGNWTAPTANDNCGVSTSSSSHAPGTLFSLGTTTVTYTADDATGNTATCTFTITVADINAPVATCQGVTVTLDSLGNASITASAVDNASTDNCGIDSISINLSNFTCADVGSNGVILTVTDLSGNTASCTAIVIVTAQPLTATLQADTTTCGYNITCPGGNDGVAHAQGDGGCPSYTYLWSNGQTTSTATGLPAGVHTVTIMDGAGVSQTFSVTLTAPAAIQVTSTTASSCLSDSTGTVSTTVTGGNNCLGYTYLWNTGATSSSLTNMPAGNFTVTVTDGAGCTATHTLTIGSFPAPNPTFTVSGDDLASVQTWATYQWLLNGSPISGATASTYTATVTGSYSLQVTDANGCTGISAISTVVGLSATAFGEGMGLYPNPARDQFRLHTAVPIQEAVTVNLYDLLGRRCTSRALPALTDDVTFDLRGYAQGTYMVEVVTTTGARRLLRLVVE